MKIFDERGVTLLELLAVITLTFITLPIIYGVFHSGLKLYDKIHYEAQMRDDADYVSSMILNQMYSIPFDSIASCDDVDSNNSCIKLVDNTSSALEKYTGDNSTFYDIDKEATKGETEQKTILIEIKKNAEGKGTFYLNGTAVDALSDFSGSKISFDCSKDTDDGCKGAIIHLTLNVSDKRTEKTLQVESQFGF